EMPAPDIQQAEANLRHTLPSVRVDYHPQLRTPVHVRCLDGCLTGPGGVGKGVQEKTLALIPRNQSHRPIRAFLLEHSSLFQVGAAELEQAVLKRDQRSRNEVVRTTVWQQQCEGIPVFESVLSAHMTRADELLAISSTFVPDVGTLSRAWDANTTELLKNPPVSAESAIGMAATSIGEDSSGLSSLSALEQGSALPQQYQAPGIPGVITASLVWLPLTRNAITLCWKIELTRRQGGERYQVLIDARSGLLMLRRCLTVYLQPATYEVFTSDSPTPLSPAYCEPTSRQPATVRREVITLSALSTNASPLGWIANNLNETRGNNVEAHLDHNADDYPDLPRPRGSPARVFRPPLDFRKIPEHNADAAVVQLFYWCNWMHDQLYDLGFTESAGNYQKDNFGRGGLGGDPIMADAQDGSGLNNANFTPTPDGEPGRIQMFIFDGPEPDRDGDFDAEIVIHEYVHGLSTRLVGGGVGISTLQAGGMGEGWSDFYALAMLSEASDDPDGCYAMGGYVTRQFFGLEENYYFGIRRYPYSTDLKKNPLTFKDLDPAQISRHATVPRSPIFPFSPGLASEVHNQGELWCATLWDARARLIRKLGFEQGNREILQLVTLGMKLSPSNPNFLQARDAILQADLAMNAGRHHEDLWSAFARRGMGFSAWSPVSSTTAGIREAFDLPDGLGVGSPDGLVFSGAVGGPFFGGMRSLLLTNHTRAVIDWTAGHDAPWLLLDPGQGRLEPGGTVRISLSISEEALGLPKGRYLSRLVLTNRTSGVTQERELDLRLMAFGSIPFEDGFEDQDLRPEWLPASPAFGRILLTALGGPQAGGQHALMDSDSDGLPARNELTLGLDMRGWTNVVLSFFAREYSDEPNLPPPSPYEFGANTDNVAISVDGRLWHEVKSLRSLTDSYKEVLVPLNETLAAAGLEYGPHMQIRFTQFDNYPIPLDGIAIDSVQVRGLPTGRYHIKLPPQIFEGSVSNEAGLVILGTPAARPIEFKLMADPPGVIVLPSILRFEVGQTQASFEMQPLDNLLLEGPRRLHIQAQAPGYFGSSALTMVQDDEPALLTIAAPRRLMESTNAMPTRVTLQLDRSPESALEIALRTLPSGKLSHPPSVIIPAGLRETSFDVVAGDNPDLEGDVHVRLMADQPGGGVVETLIAIADNDEPTLSIELPAAISEANPAQTGWVRLGGLVRTNVVVVLQSHTPGQARAVDSVTVPSGEISASFQLTPLDDAIVDGHVLVKLTGTAEGFLEGASETKILDNETPSEIYTPDPAHLAQNIPSRTFLRWRPGFGELLTNGDFESGDLRGWKTSQDGGSGFVINDGNVNPDGPESPTPPLEGGFSALLAQSTPGKHSLWQDVFIPADAESASLSWAHFIHNHGPEYFNPSQRFAVEIRSPQGDLIATAFSTKPGDNLAIEWTTNRFDLTSLRGRTVRVLFAEEDVLGFINVGIDLVSLDVHSSGRTFFDVYLGKSPDLGPSDLIATTESAEALVTGLSPESDYYWKVSARKEMAALQGPLWKFRTRPVGILDHFEWGPVSTPLQSAIPFAASLSARDEYGLVVTNFQGYVRLTAHGGGEKSDTILITEIDAGRDDQVEFTNVGVSP
ncbi:MAG: hypothetical protein FJ405_12020, partial [Verrucomicrobia bacterium]|nr:hypothetical protein [Verrucomicrobiota bacterium]